VLAIQLRYAVGRIDVLVVLDPVATKAGIGQHLTVGGVAGREGGCPAAKDHTDEQDSEGATTGQRHTDSGFDLMNNASRFWHKTGLKRAQSVRAEPQFYHRMIALIQRVAEASVRIDGRITGQIGPGLLALIGVVSGDDTARAGRLLQRVLDYRVFADAAGRMNLSLRARGGGLLLVPQFTLAADTGSGNRPGFSAACEPAAAAALFDYVLTLARASLGEVASGVFGAHMQVSLVNDGPVTFWLES
jgi:D-aminoacyl-tRNA deacylase